MGLTVLVAELAVQEHYLLAQLGDLVDQLHVLLHYVVVVLHISDGVGYLFVDLGLFLEAFLEGVDGVLEVAFLVLVLLLDVGVDLDVLDFLVLHVGVQVLVDRPLQLVEVVDELHRPVHGVCEALYEDVVRSDLRPVLLNQLLHVLLPRPQIVNDVAEVGIDLVVVLEVLVHLVGLLLEAGDLHLAGRDVALELLDLVVEHELELLELLRLLLQLVELLLSVTDQLVLGADLRSLEGYLLLQALQYVALVRHLDVLFLLVSLEFLDVALR